MLFNPSDRKEKFDLKTCQWSPRGDAILLEGDNDLWLLDPQTGGLRRLTQDADAEEVPAFSPAGDRIAFVKKHDLYVLDFESGAARRLTRDGSDTIYNGRLDWVYEEELANRSWRVPMNGRPTVIQILFLFTIVVAGLGERVVLEEGAGGTGGAGGGA